MNNFINRNLMTKTVFKRFLFFSICICLICIIIAHGVLTLPVASFLENNRKATLGEYSSQLSRYIGDATGNDIHSLNSQSEDIMRTSLDTFGSAMQALIVVVDSEGNFVYSNDPDVFNENSTLPQKITNALASGNFYEHGKLDGTRNKMYHISASPITADTDSTKITGYCFVSQVKLWTADYVPSVTLIFIIVIVITSSMIIILSSVFAYNTSRPLKQMAYAAKRFAVGDFASRVEVNRKDEIGQLATAFNEMADSLAASEGMRRNFVANVSHELKTPMTTIAGYIDGILDGTIPKEEQEHYLGIVSNEIKRLSRLVTSMISLSKIDSGEITVKKDFFEIQSTVFDVLLHFEKDIENKQISVYGLEEEDDIIAYGDRDLIYQVIHNLVENAVKFTPEKGYVKFNIYQKGGRTYVCVENSGEGILPEDLSLVFDKFYKGDKSRSSHKNSMGLGLYIARTIVLLHEGNIHAESEVNNFCRFTFWLEDAPGNVKKTKRLPISTRRAPDEQ